MRLINVSTMLVEEFITADIPPYAILSHTWEEEEVSFEDMKYVASKVKKGYSKINMACKLAEADGLAYAWVDTCSIDKSSSAELTEAINSMFKWYKNALICYVYLSDLHLNADLATSLPKCRWFSRGWTLQELIAPSHVSFFDKLWNHRGLRTDLLYEISTITGIDSAVLDQKVPLSSVPVARRMSWAAHRQTSREEDTAYCLLGIFEVSMPLLYGEGQNAFIRLQEEIIKSVCDLSIFAWQMSQDSDANPAYRYSGILAKCPGMFRSCRGIKHTTTSTFHSDFSVTNRGIRMYTSLDVLPIPNSQGWFYVQDLNCCLESDDKCRLAIRLKLCGPSIYVRDGSTSLATIGSASDDGLEHTTRYSTIYILSKLPQTVSSLRDNNFIISNRVSAIKVQLPPGLRSWTASPMSHFDGEENVFFNTYHGRYSWFVFTAQGKITVPKGKIPVSCLIICKEWDEPSTNITATIVDFLKIDSRLISQFCSVVEQEHHDHLPWPIINSDFSHFGIRQQDSVTFEKDSQMITISLAVRKVFLPDVCPNDMLQMDITWVGKR